MTVTLAQAAVLPAERREHRQTDGDVPAAGHLEGGDASMSVYKVVELIGTSNKSWEDAAAGAIKLAGKSLRGLRVAEVVEQDLDLGDGSSITYRTKLKVSFKYEGGQ